MGHVRGLKAEPARFERAHAALVLAVDDTAEFRRHGAVEVWDAHGVLVDCPLLAKDAEVYGADGGIFRRGCEDTATELLEAVPSKIGCVVEILEQTGSNTNKPSGRADLC